MTLKTLNERIIEAEATLAMLKALATFTMQVEQARERQLDIERKANTVVGRLNNELSRRAFFVLLNEVKTKKLDISSLYHGSCHILDAINHIDSVEVLDYLIKNEPIYDGNLS